MSPNGRNTPMAAPAVSQRASELLASGEQISAISIQLNKEFGPGFTYRMVYAWVEKNYPESINKRALRMMPPVKCPVFDPLPAAGPRANKLNTVFIRKPKAIPDETRTANVNALLGAAHKLANIAPHVSADYRHQAALWANSATSFAAYDVEAANPLTAAVDGRPYNWSADRQPSLVLGVSALGAAAGGM